MTIVLGPTVREIVQTYPSLRDVNISGLTCPIVMVTCSGEPPVAKAAYEAGGSKVFEAGAE